MDKTLLPLKQKISSVFQYFLLVPKEGVEPSCPQGHRFLRPTCLPFHHFGFRGSFFRDCAYCVPQSPTLSPVNSGQFCHAENYSKIGGADENRTRDLTMPL